MTDSNKVGRPSTYTVEAGNLLCKRIIDGASVRSICDLDDMPARETLVNWLVIHEEFSHQYAQALHYRTHLKAEERHNILEDALTELKKLDPSVNASVWGNLIKERIRAIEWDAERLAAKRYKVKPDVEVVAEAVNNIMKVPYVESVEAWEGESVKQHEKNGL